MANPATSRDLLPRSPDRAVLLCRTELESALCEELAARGNRTAAAGLGFVLSEGLGSDSVSRHPILADGGAAVPPGGAERNLVTHLPSEPLVFERQRIPAAGWIPEPLLKPIADDTLELLTAGLAPGTLWTIHAICPQGVQDPRWSKSAGGIASAILRRLRTMHPELAASFDASRATTFLQILRIPGGAWHGVGTKSDGVSRHPGGILRLKFDSRAPSRSYLKLEEAFAVMGTEPEPGNSVVDLGAAPGGWTHACLKRGAFVTAVDNGPMRIDPGFRPRLRTVRANGITFEPRDGTSVDWLVADMLIPPGTALGLLRRWMGRALCRHAVVNLKLPQTQPYRALEPVLSFLRTQGGGWDWAVRNLHHDRREVTLMAALRSAASDRGRRAGRRRAG